MNFLIVFYFPVACLAMAWTGSSVLRAVGNIRGFPLAFCRLFLLAFPFLMLATSLWKTFGPSLWMAWASPMPFRGMALLVMLGLVGARWVGEMVAGLALRWRVEGPDMEREASRDFLDALGYENLTARLAPRPWLSWLPRPRLFWSKAASPAHLTSGLRPRICLDASLVPATYRKPDLWWHSVLPEPHLVAESLDPLRAVVAHELAHYKRGDHLRTLLTLVTGAILPWEWLFGQVSLDKFSVTRTWVFKQWSRFMNALGLPVRRWLQEEHAIREALADEEATSIVAGASRHLVEVRALYRLSPQEGLPPSRGGTFRILGILGPLALGGALLWAAPGRLPYLSTFGNDLASTPLPRGWCLTLEGRSNASAVYIPGNGGRGRVLIACQHIDPGHPPEFRAIGRQGPSSIPAPCEIEVRWDVHFIGAQPLSGKEAVLSLTQSGALVRENNDLVAAYSLAAQPMARMKGGWVRYALKIQVEGAPMMDILFICYKFSAPGRYLFKPPALTILSPDGERRPYPEV